MGPHMTQVMGKHRYSFDLRGGGGLQFSAELFIAFCKGGRAAPHLEVPLLPTGTPVAKTSSEPQT